MLRFVKSKQEKDLSSVKHVSGDFNRWITRFKDQEKVCDIIGVVLTGESYLNESILWTVSANVMEIRKRI